MFDIILFSISLRELVLLSVCCRVVLFNECYCTFFYVLYFLYLSLIEGNEQNRPVWKLTSTLSGIVRTLAFVCVSIMYNLLETIRTIFTVNWTKVIVKHMRGSAYIMYKSNIRTNGPVDQIRSDTWRSGNIYMTV